MKIRIEMEDALEEDEIIIRCSQLTEEIIRLQRMLQQESNNSGQFILYKETRNTTYRLLTFSFSKPNREVCAYIPEPKYTKPNISYTNWKNSFPAISLEFLNLLLLIATRSILSAEI